MVTACDNVSVQQPVLLNYSIFYIAVTFKITAVNTFMVKSNFLCL
jgi:hypothetical protein